jgi:methyl-accepting chemotaxis protein
MPENDQGTDMFKKILFAMFLVISLPMASLWYFSSYKIQNEIALKVNDDLARTSEIVATKIDDWSDMNLRLLNEHSNLSQIKSGVEAQQRPILQSIVKSYEWLYLAYVIGSDGYKTARSDDEPIRKLNGEKAHFRGDRSYFKQIVNGATIGEQLVLSRTLNKPAFILCKAIKQANKVPYDGIGALCIGSTVSQLSDLVVNTKIGKTGYAVLFDSTNKVIAHGGGKVLEGQLQDFSDSEMIKSARLNNQFMYRENEKDMIGYMKPAGRGWKLIVTQEYDDAYSSHIESNRELLLFFFLTIVIGITISYFMARKLAGPILTMAMIANDIRKGRFYNKIEESSRTDEIGELARALEKMSVSMSIAFKKLKQRTLGN